MTRTFGLVLLNGLGISWTKYWLECLIKYTAKTIRYVGLAIIQHGSTHHASCYTGIAMEVISEVKRWLDAIVASVRLRPGYFTDVDLHLPLNLSSSHINYWCNNSRAAHSKECSSPTESDDGRVPWHHLALVHASSKKVLILFPTSHSRDAIVLVGSLGTVHGSVSLSPSRFQSSKFHQRCTEWRGATTGPRMLEIAIFPRSGSMRCFWSLSLLVLFLF